MTAGPAAPVMNTKAEGGSTRGRAHRRTSTTAPRRSGHPWADPDRRDAWVRNSLARGRVRKTLLSKDDGFPVTVDVGLGRRETGST